MTMDHLAARLVGGFIQPIDADALHEAVKTALVETALGELDRIKALPGMARAAVDTLGARYGAPASTCVRGPRSRGWWHWQRSNRRCSRQLPPSMQLSPALAECALERLRHAPAVIGPIEVRGHSEMPPCWRQLLLALTDVVPVTWVAGPRQVPAWLLGTNVEIRITADEAPRDEPAYLRQPDARID